jgi:DNA-binding transcriptional ArsR family regulator
MKKNNEACGAARPKLEERPLLSFVQAVEVMALFKVLANDTRIRLLHEIIRNGEANVTAIAKSLGMKPQAVSNQLQRLADTGIVGHRREGNSIYYRVVDCCVPVLLDQALCTMEALRASEGASNGAARSPAPSPARRG